MTAPTEAEIREALDEHGTYPKDSPLPEQLRQLIDEWANAIVSPAFDALESPDPREPAGIEGALWRDLRPSEAVRLREIVNAAVERAQDRCLEDVILEELVMAAKRFAAEFPDAPRGA